MLFFVPCKFQYNILHFSNLKYMNMNIKRHMRIPWKYKFYKRMKLSRSPVYSNLLKFITVYSCANFKFKRKNYVYIYKLSKLYYEFPLKKYRKETDLQGKYNLILGWKHLQIPIKIVYGPNISNFPEPSLNQHSKCCSFY